MVGENRLGNVVLQMPTEKELLTQRSLRSESGAGGDFGLWILDFELAEEIAHAKAAKDGKFECGPTSLSLGKPR